MREFLSTLAAAGFMSYLLLFSLSKLLIVAGLLPSDWEGEADNLRPKAPMLAGFSLNMLGLPIESVLTFVGGQNDRSIVALIPFVVVASGFLLGIAASAKEIKMIEESRQPEPASSLDARTPATLSL
jgi:hypothetical protein